MLHLRDGARFPGIQAKEFNLGFIRESCFSWSESPLVAFWQTPSWLSCLLLRSGFRLATLPSAEMVVLLEGSPTSTEELWSSVRVTIEFLVTSLNEALLPRLLSLAERPALGRVLVGSKLLTYLRMTAATLFLGTFNAADILAPFASTQSGPGALWTTHLTP